MTLTEKWKEIVQNYRDNWYTIEMGVQNVWIEYCYKIFGYSQKNNEVIASERFVGIKKEDILNLKYLENSKFLDKLKYDIILRKNNKDIIVIESTAQYHKYKQKLKNDLINYLKKLHISVGILICKRIYVYLYDFTGNSYKKIIINYDFDNKIGEEFIRTFSRKNFSVSKVKTFINTANKKNDK